MTIKTIVISNQDCFDGEWNALRFTDLERLVKPRVKQDINPLVIYLEDTSFLYSEATLKSTLEDLKSVYQDCTDASI